MRRLSNPYRYLMVSLPILLMSACTPAPPVPQAQMTPEQQVQQQVLRGRDLVIHHGCGDCHGGVDNPAAQGWLSGWRPEFPAGVGQYPVGPFTTYARNLTPDNTTGIGRFRLLV